MTTNSPSPADGDRSALATSRDLARDRLRKWYTTPDAVEQACLDAREMSGYWASRNYLLRVWLKEAAEKGDETAKAALAWDEGNRVTMSEDLPVADMALRYTRLEGIRLGRRVEVDTAAGLVGPGVVTAIDGKFRDSVVHLVTADGTLVAVAAEDSTGYRFV